MTEREANPMAGASARAFAYHEQTKHYPHRYARSAGYLDWETQPEPFRTYTGAPRIDLPLAADDLEARYCDLYAPDSIAPSELNANSLGAFFELALGPHRLEGIRRFALGAAC